MNHQKVYESIIQKVKSENRIKKSYYERKKENFISTYYEDHHIIPRCLGGTDDKENKVLLTAKEHYICHKLLTYIYKGDKKIANAFCRMTWDKNGRHNISAKDYAYAKELKSKIPISEETKLKISNALIGKKRKPFSEEHKHKISLNSQKKRKPRSEETKQKLSDSHKGKKFSKEHIKNLSESHKGPHPKNRNHADFKGQKNPFYGKQHSNKTKKIISQKKSGVIESEETKQKKSISMIGKNKYKRTEETKRKLSNSLMGRKLTSEHKLNISKNNGRRKNKLIINESKIN